MSDNGFIISTFRSSIYVHMLYQFITLSFVHYLSIPFRVCISALLGSFIPLLILHTFSFVDSV